MAEIENKKRSLIFVNIMISAVATSMLATAMTTALPPVTEYFGVSITTGQWLTSGFSLAQAIVMPLTAFLITKYPTRKLYLSGIACFLAGELVSLLAGNFGVMMLGRVLQACGNGVLASMAQVIILTIYPAERRGTMMGWFGLAVGTAPIIAPTLAGILVDTVGWKAIFSLTMGIMVLSLLMALAVFDDVLELQDKKFDVLSFVGSIFAFGGLTLGIGNLGTAGLLSLQAGVPLAVGAASGVFFVARQWKLEKAFLDVRILRCKEYALSVTGSMLLYLVMMGGSVLMPLYVQSVLGHSATVSGLVTLPGSVATALVSPFAGKLYDKVGIKVLFVSGSALLLASNLAMYFVTLNTPLWLAALFNVLRNVSIGALMMPLLTWGVSFVEEKKVADASSLLTALRTVAGSIGSAVFVSVMTVVAAGSAAAYGAAAEIHGLNVAFASMSGGSIAMLLLAIFVVKGKRRTVKISV